MDKALITTVPFGDKNRLLFELLEEAGIEYLINPLGRKLTEQELADIIPGFEVLISGTEPITSTGPGVGQPLCRCVGHASTVRE